MAIPSTHKRGLKARGWSYRAAAQELGVSYQHVCMVLNGQRRSNTLLVALAALPARHPAKRH